MVALMSVSLGRVLALCCLGLVAVHASSLTPPPAFGSSAVRHLEPVRDFRVVHADMHLATPNVRTVDGHLRPLPDQLTVEFSVYGEAHAYELDIMSVFEPHSTMSLVGEGDVVDELPWTITSYRKVFANGDWVVATLRDDGTMHAAINQGGSLLVIDPLSVHEREMHPANFHQLSAAAAEHGMVAFRTQDQILDGNNTHLCGEVEHPADEEPTPTLRNFTAGLRGPARHLLTVTPWSDCRSPFIAMKFLTGVAADYGFYKAAGNSAAAVSSYIAQLYTTMNLVYLQQLNVFLSVQASVIMSVGGTTTYPWNRDRTTAACPTISSSLSTLTSWRSTVKPTQQGVWHQLTDCYPPPGTVGLAYVGALCSKNYGTGISSFSSSMWLTVAHELGHNFGAQHTFQNGQGTTGGIMDYGNGKINGEYQFSTTYSKAEMCTQIVKSLSTTSRTGLVAYAACWESYAPTCGNGVVESGEQCDDGAAGSACCTNTCTWTAGSQCSSASGGECCVACKYRPSSATCSSGSGYCANGVCTSSFCSTYGLAYCGTQPTNACKQRCVINGACNTMAGYTDSSTGQPLPVGIANGVKCGNLSTSLCANAACSGV